MGMSACGKPTNVLATSAVALDGVRNSIRGKETNLGNLIGDAFLYSANLCTASFGLAPAGNGTAVVSEKGNDRVHHIDLATGEGLGAWGTAGREVGAFADPWAVAVTDGAKPIDAEQARGWDGGGRCIMLSSAGRGVSPRSHLPAGGR